MYLRYSGMLKEELFESKQTKIAYRTIVEHHRDYKDRLLSIRGFRLLIEGLTTESNKLEFRGLVRRVKKNTILDTNIADKLLKKFAKRQLLKQGIMEALDSLESGEETNLERVKQKIDEAISVDSGSLAEETYDYFDDPYKRAELERNEERLATKISSELDASMDGGLGPGEIGIIIAPTNVGKTLTLINIGYGAMLQGRKIIHVTLEITARKVARRYDSRISGYTYSDIKTKPGLLRKKLGALTRAGAGLQIKDATSCLFSVNDLRAYLDRIKSNGFDFGLIIVDHIDLMYSPRQYKEHRHELSSIVAGLRRLGGEFSVPVWTASQAGRKAGAAGRTKLWDIAEDIGKANWADFAVTLSQNEEEREEGLMYMNVAKNRIGDKRPNVKVIIDYPTLTIKAIERNIKQLRKELRG